MHDTKRIYKFQKGFIANSSGVAYFLHVFKLQIPNGFTAGEMIESFGIEKDSLFYRVSNLHLKAHYKETQRYRISPTDLEGKKDGFGQTEGSYLAESGELDVKSINLLTLSPDVKVIYNDHYRNRYA